MNAARTRAAIASLLEIAANEGAPRAWLKLYGQQLGERVLDQLRDRGWVLVPVGKDPQDTPPAAQETPGATNDGQAYNRRQLPDRRRCTVCPGDFCYCGHRQRREP